MIRHAFFSAVVAILMSFCQGSSAHAAAPEEQLIEAVKVALGKKFNTDWSGLDALPGIKWAPLSSRGSFTREYAATTTPNEVRSRLVPTPPPGNETDTDLALFAQGYVTLTLLDGDLSAGTGPAAASIISSLSALALPEPAARK